MRALSAWLVLAATTATLAATPAAAFLCTRTPNLGPSVAWGSRQVILHRSGAGNDVGVDSVAVDRALSRGVAQWTGLSCSDLDVSLGVETTDLVVGFDWHAGSDDPSNQNIVVFRDAAPDDPVDAWLHTFGALAITTVTFESASGRLLDADIEVNDVSFDFTACDPEEASCVVVFDLENTLTHEIGHVIGLDHPPSSEPGAVEATMFASASEGDVGKRTLASDDEAGACTIYPAGDVTGECFGVGRGTPPAVRFSQSWCAQGEQADSVALPLALLLGLARGRSGKGRAHRDPLA
jgi:hypothetical protein